MNSCQDITELELTELSSLLKQMGGEPFTASQIYQWIYKRGVTDFTQMTDLPFALRTKMAESCTVQTPKIVRTDNSRDGTVKFLLSHTDNQCVETVFYPRHASHDFLRIDSSWLRNALCILSYRKDGLDP